MKNYFKKFSIMFAMSLILILGCCTSAFATDNGVIGTENLNNTPQNSAKIGQSLYNPEIGWKRIDDSNENFKYNSLYNQNQNSLCYNGTNHHGDSGTIQFNFTGTKIRIIIEPSPYSYNIDDINISIDGNVYTFSTNNKSIYEFPPYGSITVPCALAFEKLDLSNKEHYVTITKEEQGAMLMFDAVDIDSTGELKSYNGNLPIDVSSISLNKSTDSLQIGQTDNLVATTTPSGAQVTWTSSDANIATVDSTGKITAIKAGTVTITASTSDGLTAICTVTVTNATGGNTTPTDPTTPTDGTSTIVNIAHAKGDNTNNAGGEVSIIFNGLPDTTLSVVKTADVKSVYVGDTFTYTIVVTNTGTKTAKSVVINDSAPNHIQFMPSGITTTQGTVDPSSTSSNILVNVGDIPPLGTVTIKIPATVIL